MRVYQPSDLRRLLGHYRPRRMNRRWSPGWWSTGGGGGSSAPLDWFDQGSSPGGIAPGANKVWISGFVLPAPITFSSITMNVQTADAVNNVDWGIYSPAGNLLTHIGAQIVAATGYRRLATSGAPVTLAPGRYLFAFTTNSATFAIFYSANTATAWAINTNVAASAGGALPASIGAVAIAPSNNFPHFFSIG